MLFGLLPTVLLEGPALADFWPVLPELLYAGVFSVGIAYTLQMMARGYASTTLAAFILSLESVFAALSGWLLLDQGLSLIAVSGCGLIFAAIIIADVFPDSWFRRPASSPPMNSPSHASLDLVLIGGGHAQIQVLKDFAMKPEPGVRLTLVTDVLDTPYSGMLPGYVEGVWSHTDMHINLVRLARFAGARLIHNL